MAGPSVTPIATVSGVRGERVACGPGGALGGRRAAARDARRRRTPVTAPRPLDGALRFSADGRCAAGRHASGSSCRRRPGRRSRDPRPAVADGAGELEVHAASLGRGRRALLAVAAARRPSWSAGAGAAGTAAAWLTLLDGRARTPLRPLWRGRRRAPQHGGARGAACVAADPRGTPASGPGRSELRADAGPVDGLALGDGGRLLALTGFGGAVSVWHGPDFAARRGARATGAHGGARRGRGRARCVAWATAGGATVWAGGATAVLARAGRRARSRSTRRARGSSRSTPRPLLRDRGDPPLLLAAAGRPRARTASSPAVLDREEAAVGAADHEQRRSRAAMRLVTGAPAAGRSEQVDVGGRVGPAPRHVRHVDVVGAVAVGVDVRVLRRRRAAAAAAAPPPPGAGSRIASRTSSGVAGAAERRLRPACGRRGGSAARRPRRLRSAVTAAARGAPATTSSSAAAAGPRPAAPPSAAGRRSRAQHAVGRPGRRRRPTARSCSTSSGRPARRAAARRGRRRASAQRCRTTSRRLAFAVQPAFGGAASRRGNTSPTISRGMSAIARPCSRVDVELAERPASPRSSARARAARGCGTARRARTRGSPGRATARARRSRASRGARDDLAPARAVELERPRACSPRARSRRGCTPSGRGWRAGGRSRPGW